MPPSLKERFEKKKSKIKKKHLARRINDVARQVSQMSKSCKACEKQFDPNVPGALDTWLVTVGHESSFLTCPECSAAGSAGSTTTPKE